MKSFLALPELAALNTANKSKYCGMLKNKQGLTLPVLCPGEAIYTKAQKIQNIAARVAEWRILIH